MRKQSRRSPFSVFEQDKTGSQKALDHPLYQRTQEEQYVDSWDRFFTQTKLLHENAVPVEEQCARMCNIMMTRDERLRTLVKKQFRPEDYFEIRDHMVGTGMVGGKTCGMLLARAIIRNLAPEIDRVLEPMIPSMKP